MAKAVKTVGTILVVGGLALATAGAALIPAIAGGGLAGALGTAIGGITAGQLITVGSILSSVGATPKVGAGGSPTQWKIDPDGGIPFAVGQVGVAGTIVYRREFGPENMYQGVVSVLSGAGPINRFVSFSASDESVSFDGSGKATSSQYRDELFTQTRLGTSSQAYMVQGGLKNGATLTGWGPSHRLLGKAARMLTMAENSKGTAFPNGEPAPLDVIEGILYWDPRQDSTYPGGSGPCRLDNPATWVYGTNPIIHALKWWLGYFENGKLVGGVGMSPDAIDIASFVECANIADANGWIISGYPNTKDDKHQVGIAMLQAGGAVYASVGGKVSCISRGAPRASLLNVTGGDTAGPVEIDAAASRVGRINTIIPKFNGGAAFRYEMTAGSPVSFSGYVDQDRGNTRIRGVDYPYVPQATQAAQLAAFDIVDSREGIVGVVPFKPHMRRLKPGMAFTFSEPGFVLSGLKCLVLNREYNPADGVVKITFRSETDGKYDLALGKTTVVPPPPSLTPPDPTVAPPDPLDWVVIPRQPGEDGVEVPIIDVVGEVTSATATEMIVEWAPPPDPPPPDPLPEPEPGQPPVQWSDYLDWRVAYAGPPTTERVSITMPPGQVYYLAITYRRGGNSSLRTVLPGGPFNAPGLVAADLSRESEAWDELIAEAGAAAGQAVRDLEERLTAADEAFDERLSELDDGLDGVKLIQAAHTSQIAGKAEQSALQAQITRLDGQESLIGSLQTTVADLPNQYVSAASYNTLQSEVVGARGGTANLNSRFTSERQTTNSGLAGKANASDLTALSGTVSSQGSTITAQGGRLTTVEAALPGKASASELSTLTGRVTSAEGTLVAQNTRLNTVEAGLNGKASATSVSELTAEVGTVKVTATNAASVAASADGKASALVGNYTDNQGVISGTFGYNDGIRTSYRIKADIFELIPSTSTGRRTSWENGKLSFWNANNIDVIQLGFDING